MLSLPLSDNWSQKLSSVGRTVLFFFFFVNKNTNPCSLIGPHLFKTLCPMHGSLDFLPKSCTGRYFEFPFCWRVNWGSEGSLRPRSWEEHYKLIKPAATTIYYIPEAWWTFRSFGFIFLTSEMKWLSQRKLRTLLWVPCRGVWEERRERNREAVAISEDGSGDKGQEGLVEKAWPPSLSDRRGDSGRRTRALFSFSLPPESTGCSTQWQFFKKKKN